MRGHTIAQVTRHWYLIWNTRVQSLVTSNNMVYEATLYLQEWACRCHLKLHLRNDARRRDVNHRDMSVSGNILHLKPTAWHGKEFGKPTPLLVPPSRDATKRAGELNAPFGTTLENRSQASRRHWSQQRRNKPFLACVSFHITPAKTFLNRCRASRFQPSRHAQKTP